MAKYCAICVNKQGKRKYTFTARKRRVIYNYLFG